MDSTTSTQKWINLFTFTGTGDDTYSATIPEEVLPEALRLRFRFVSDWWDSDEDGWFDSNGAVILDDITISDSTGVLNVEDFENETIGDTSTVDGDWQAYRQPGFGDFSGLFPGLAVLQEDDCTRDNSWLWGFFKGSTYVYNCTWPLHPEQPVVPYENERGQYIWNEIWSPWIDLNPGGSIPSTASDVLLEFQAYRNPLCQ